jgi:nicotinamide phosphoribosyltransferase
MTTAIVTLPESALYAHETYNSVMLIDGYKLDHRRQYPDGTQQVESNFTPRGTRIPGGTGVYWLGVQAFLQRFLMDELKEFFASDIDKSCNRYVRRVNKYLGPNTVGAEHIRAWHALGYTPLRFSSLPEGSFCPIGIPALIITNTHDDFGWLVNYYESLLSCELWGTPTSATTAFRFRNLFKRFAKLTGSPDWFIDWQGHDFSMRGMFGLEAAQLSGIGHLLAFKGTDTIPAIDFIEKFYGGLWEDGGFLPDSFVIGGSVPATEHSVMCAGGEDNELGTIDRLLNLYPEGIVSVVSDTWDLWYLITVLLPKLKDRIMARNGKLVIRPDSGDPVKIICGEAKQINVTNFEAEAIAALQDGYEAVRVGNNFYRVWWEDINTRRGDAARAFRYEAVAPTPAMKGVIELLYDIFGGTQTETGHILLDSHIGAIYGDGINYERAEAILQGLADKGFASANIVFGLGSFTYQYVTRDTWNWAMKATWCRINNEPKDIFKAPKTDDSHWKKSAVGQLAVIRNAQGKLELIHRATPEQRAQTELRDIWEDGKFLIRDRWDTIVARAHAEEAA